MYILSAGLLIAQYSDGLTSVTPFLIIGLLLILSGLISGSEVAYFSLTPADLLDLETQVETEQSPAAQRVIELIKRPDSDRAPRHLLATILVLNNLVNIVIILISTVVMERLFPASDLDPWAYWTLHVGAVTFLIVLFGEVVPKVYATNHRVQFAQTMSGPLLVGRKALTPVWKPLVRLGNWVEKTVAVPSTDVSAADLEQALHLTADEERTDEEQRILESIAALGDKGCKASYDGTHGHGVHWFERIMGTASGTNHRIRILSDPSS